MTAVELQKAIISDIMHKIALKTNGLTAGCIYFVQ